MRWTDSEASGQQCAPSQLDGELDHEDKGQGCSISTGLETPGILPRVSIKFYDLSEAVNDLTDGRMDRWTDRQTCDNTPMASKSEE